MARIYYEDMEFENAYVYRKCSVQLANQGLVLVRGLNLDDGGYLGAGKSSLFEVFAQVQMGKGGKRDQRKGDQKSDIVNMYADDGCSVKLRLRVDGHPYEIAYYRQHHRFGNKLMVLDRNTGVDVIPKSASRQPFKWVRESLLQIDETSFFNLIYLVQELNNVMVHGAEYERRNRLTVMFNLDVYDELKDRVKRAYSMNETALADFEQVRSELEEVTDRLYGVADLNQLEDELDAVKTKLETAQKEHATDMEEYTTLSDLHTRMTQKTELRGKIMRLFKGSDLFKHFTHPKDITSDDVEAYKQQHSAATAELHQLRSKLSGIQRRKIIEAQLEKVSGRSIEEIQTDLTDVKSTLTTLTNIELPQAEERTEILSKLQKIEEPPKTLEELEEENDILMVEESKLQSRIKLLDSQLREAVCPHCNRPYDMTPAEIAQLQGELTDKRDALRVASQRLHTVKKQLTASRKILQLKSKLNALKVTRSPEEVMKDIRAITGRERKLAGELELAQKRLVFTAELEHLPQGNVIETEAMIAAAEALVERLLDSYNTAKFIVDKLADLRDLPSGNVEDIAERLSVLKDQLRRVTRVVSEASSEVTQLETYINEIRQLQRRQTTLRRTLEQQISIVEETKCLKALVQTFGSSGMKQDRFHAILTDATERTVPIYTDVLWPNRNVSLSLSEADGSLQFQLDRLDTHMSTKSALLSGGERHKAGLAFLFGMRDLKELYTRTSSNLIIVDEPFGNMDPLGTEGLISIFTQLKQRFGSVFVVSHRPEVLSHPIWDQTWWAIRENNTATLYTSDPPAEYQKLAAELVKQ